MKSYFSQLPEGTLLPFVTSFSREITLFLRQGNPELLTISKVFHSNQSNSRYPIYIQYNIHRWIPACPAS